MKKEVLLSVCIPTYNKGERIFALVNDYLSQIDDRVEVLVVDDCSSDNTRKLLADIQDERFSFYVNRERFGYPNMVNAMMKGKGKYSILVGDKDRIIWEDGWLDRLERISDERDKVSFILCNYLMGSGEYLLNLGVEGIQGRYRQGTMGIFELAISCAGFSAGIIWKKDALLDLFETKLIDKENLIWKLYPQMYVTFLMGKFGDAVAWKEEKFIIREMENKKPNRVFGELIKGKQPYFTIESRYEQCKSWIAIINESQSDKHIKNCLLISRVAIISNYIVDYYRMLHKDTNFTDSGLYASYRLLFEEDKQIKKSEWLRRNMFYIKQLKKEAGTLKNGCDFKLHKYFFRKYCSVLKNMMKLLII